MSDVLRFYDWLLNENLVGRKVLPFRKAAFELPVFNAVGVKRTLIVYKRELSIPNRKSSYSDLEYGLEPLTQKQKKDVLFCAKTYGSEELYLMLLISFASGMRLGTICDLKIQTIYNAIPSFESKKIFHLSIGPSVHGAPVATKFDINGRVVISEVVLNEIKKYCSGNRRILRASKASSSVKDILFLNRNGMPYARKGKDQSSSLNVELFRIRKSAARNGIDISSFKFHAARATFASEVAVLGLKTFGYKNLPAVIGLVKNLLMHKHEKTSLAYISFLKQQELLDSFQNVNLEGLDLAEDGL
ncbi:hypothetical protein [Pseudomonas oryzihabitans]|uniref:hypothetical protein n=1 Tax=Pseudomonas oryzihabitans TaxID=47885 RepID=UPI0028636119|nr:hypothetical protein [Pseudomonas psychrotolerans]MDR6679506.1 integrase [Pseudomonas psychrotolerans]